MAATRFSNLPSYQGACYRYAVRVEPARIGYVNAVLESYEWLARIQTLDIQKGVLEILVAGDWDGAFQEACAELARNNLLVFEDWQRPLLKRTVL